MHLSVSVRSLSALKTVRSSRQLAPSNDLSPALGNPFVSPPPHHKSRSPNGTKNAHVCGRLIYSFGNYHQMRKESLVLVRTVPDET